MVQENCRVKVDEDGARHSREKRRLVGEKIVMIVMKGEVQREVESNNASGQRRPRGMAEIEDRRTVKDNKRRTAERELGVGKPEDPRQKTVTICT